MSLAPNLTFWLAILIMVAAAVVFVWHMVSTTRRVGLLVSEGRVPRRYLVLGFLAGVGVLYMTRR